MSRDQDRATFRDHRKGQHRDQKNATCSACNVTKEKTAEYRRFEKALGVK